MSFEPDEAEPESKTECAICEIKEHDAFCDICGCAVCYGCMSVDSCVPCSDAEEE